MINVSMASWLHDVHGFMSRVRRRNRLTAIAADDRQKMIMDTIFCLLCKIFIFKHASDILDDKLNNLQFIYFYDTYIKYLRN